jgi:hypothetical protein
VLQGWLRVYADDALTRGLVADLAWSVFADVQALVVDV